MLSKNCCKFKSVIRRRFYGSLALAFNSNEHAKTYKKYENEKVTGLFGISELKNPAELVSLRYKAENDCHLLIKEALSPMRFRKIVEILDDMSDSVCRVADLSECMRLLHPSDEVRQISMSVSQTMSKLVEELNINQELFLVLDNVVKNNVDVKPLDDVDIRVGSLLHTDFQASGINLSLHKRQKYVEETQKSIQFGSLFYEGTELSVKIKASLLPKRLQDNIGLKPDQKIEIDHPYSLETNSFLREMGYRVFYCNNPEQENLLRNLMESRYNVASFSGFSSFSERANIHLICETPTNIKNFLTRLSSRLLPFAEIDRLKILQAKYGKKLMKSDLYSENYKMFPWDFPYYMNSIKEATVHGSYEPYYPYLSLGNCMEGINMLFKSQFGIELEVEETIPGELWHSDVFKVSVRHETTGHLGTVYCDMFSRPDKPSTDCHYTIRAGKQLSDDLYQSPIVVLHGNLKPVSPDRSLAFLSPNIVETLFHEWGHALHSLLARTRYQHVAGTRCSTDLAEVPSTLMEHFALDNRVIKEYSRHYQTGENLPDKMITSLSQQRYLCSAIDHQMTIVDSMFDQIIHGDDLPLFKRESCEIYADIFSDNSIVTGSKVFDRADDCKPYRPQRFGHLLNYGAKYYSYLMSNCIVGFLWKNGFQLDPWSNSVGERYKNTILQHGGEKKAIEMIADFANSKEITIDSLVDGFIDDLENNYKI